MKYHDKYFKREEIIERFELFEGNKTFEEVDFRDVFKKQVPAKGILGCVIEQSILEMKQNSKQEPDIEILQEDGKYKSTELKVTGVVGAKSNELKAKEPLSVTAVSIGNIENETFRESHFYNKIAHMLWIFYRYEKKDGEKTVPYSEYKRFKILGYKFLDIADDELELARFENDWLQVQKYIIEANKCENPKEKYPLLHQSIKKNLFYIDIAPRYKTEPKQTPRFRLKKSYVNTIFQEFCDSQKKQLEILRESFSSYSDLDIRLHMITEKYRGKSVDELIDILNIEVKDRGKVPYSIMENIVVKMLGGKSKKISNIEVFRKIGMIAKTITVTKKGSRTEDMKLFTMNLNEIRNESLEYEETSYYDYFNNHQLLCIMFEEPSINAKLNDNRFLGFKRFAFDEGLINGDIKNTYDIVCDRINNNTLIEEYMYSKDGSIRINDTGIEMVALNFPKSAEFQVFVRGTGNNSEKKPWTFQGKAADGSHEIKAYHQQFWIKGSYIANQLKDIDFI